MSINVLIMFYDLCLCLSSVLRVFALMWRNVVKYMSAALTMTCRAEMEVNPRLLYSCWLWLLPGGPRQCFNSALPQCLLENTGSRIPVGQQHFFRAALWIWGGRQKTSPPGRTLLYIFSSKAHQSQNADTAENKITGFLTFSGCVIV